MLGFVVGFAQGAAILFLEGSIPGWSGPPIEQVLWHAVAVVVFLTLTFGLPALAVALLGWRLAIRAFGHPRPTAFVIAGLAVVAAAFLIPRTDAIHIVFLVGVPALVFAAIVREPPAESGSPKRDLP